MDESQNLVDLCLNRVPYATSDQWSMRIRDDFFTVKTILTEFAQEKRKLAHTIHEPLSHINRVCTRKEKAGKHISRTKAQKVFSINCLRRMTCPFNRYKKKLRRKGAKGSFSTSSFTLSCRVQK